MRKHSGIPSHAKGAIWRAFNPDRLLCQPLPEGDHLSPFFRLEHAALVIAHDPEIWPAKQIPLPMGCFLVVHSRQLFEQRRSEFCSPPGSAASRGNQEEMCTVVDLKMADLALTDENFMNGAGINRLKQD